MARGRTLGSMGQAFMPVGVDHATDFTPRQPVRVRWWGIPTGYGYSGRWNSFLPPVLISVMAKLLEMFLKTRG